MQIGLPAILRMHLCILIVAICSATAQANASITDLFGRDITSFGLTLPDWEGYMANPAIKFAIAPPPQFTLPVKAVLFTEKHSLYFDMPSDTSDWGAHKELVFNENVPQSVFIATFPARQKHADVALLHIQFTDANGQRSINNVPLHIRPILSKNRDPLFPITIDFSHDKSGFYASDKNRAVFKQAVADWAFYLKDMHVQPVAAGTEESWISDLNGFTSGHTVTNQYGYEGFLLYAFGIKGPELRSGGASSDLGGFQRNDDGILSIRRSGMVATEVDGNYNTLGWLSPSLAEKQWWRTTNLSNVPNDLYSILHHEIGHAIFFSSSNRSFPNNGPLQSTAARAYLGADIKTDSHAHFDGIVDPVSQHGAFGNEFHGNTPFGRWLITKFDLLCIQALGYQLRDVAALLPLSIPDQHLPAVRKGRAYHATLVAQGGVPVYDWEVDPATLPAGLSLNRFTGEISGTVQQTGTYAFTAKVRDYSATETTAERQFEIVVS